MLQLITAILVLVAIYLIKKFLVEPQDELSEKSILKIRKDELDASAKQWKARVEKSDAENFSVAGRMQNDDVPLSILTPDKVRRTPSYKRFKSKEGE